MKILLLGCRGQVGWELQRALAPLGDVTALGRDRSDGLCGDLENADELLRTVRSIQPQIIVNAAAYTDVNGAEADPQRAERINAAAPRVLAAAAVSLDAWLVHFSTDYVFDGGGTAPWREDDTPEPLNVYGATKWRGEQAIRHTGCRHLILRTQWVYATRGKNFIHKMLQAASELETLQVVDDQTGAPTGAELIADATAHALRLATQRAELSGTYHLVARGEATWYSYAQFVIDHARRAGWPVRLPDSAVLPVKSSVLATDARRPRNARLDVARLEQAFGLRMPHWRFGVSRVLAELTSR
jgi:dTDP-4-dehydrorhamnose reductase